jgi:hypothetical protein
MAVTPLPTLADLNVSPAPILVGMTIFLQTQKLQNLQQQAMEVVSPNGNL